MGGDLHDEIWYLGSQHDAATIRRTSSFHITLGCPDPIDLRNKRLQLNEIKTEKNLWNVVRYDEMIACDLKIPLLSLDLGKITIRKT